MSEGIAELEDKCKTSIEHFRRALTKMRTGRANTSLIEDISVDYYGSSTPLKQLGLVSAPEARMLTVQVYDGGAVDSIEKAIQQSDLGLNPNREGNFIRINIPPLTEERRKDLVKTLNKDAEESKISIRGHRRDAIDLLKKQVKNKEISEDDRHKGQEDVQKITDQYTAQVDSLLADKEKEMMEV